MVYAVLVACICHRDKITLHICCGIVPYPHPLAFAVLQGALSGLGLFEISHELSDVDLLASSVFAGLLNTGERSKYVGQTT